MLDLLKIIDFLRLTHNSWRGRLTVILVVGVSVISGIANTGLLALINGALAQLNAGASELPIREFIGFCVLLPVSRFISIFLLAKLSHNTLFELRVRLSRNILASPLRRLEEIGSPKLLATLTDDVGRISGAIVNIPLLCMHVSVVLSCLVYMGWLSWQLLLIILGFVVLGILSYRLPVGRAMHHFQITRDRWDDLLKQFEGLAYGTKELKIHRARRQTFFSSFLENTADQLRSHNIIGARIYALANSWGQVLFFLVIGLFLFVVPQQMAVNVEVVTGYILTILFIMTPLDVLMNTLPNLSRATIAIQKIEKMGISLSTEEADDYLDVPLLPPPSWNRLELVDVLHTYSSENEGESFTLGPIDLTFKPGELVFFVGGNGSGKTTLAKMLVGLYPPDQGDILLDGKALTYETRDDYREQFSAVFSDFYLFDNLLGLESSDLDEKALKYLHELQLEKKVTVQDGSLSTVKLSQGQRKRLALLTAYLEDRSVYLFDEWAADQDPEFKEVFYSHILRELTSKQKTVFVITHDDRYWHVADRVIKLEYGRIVSDERNSGERIEAQAS